MPLTLEWQRFIATEAEASARPEDDDEVKEGSPSSQKTKTKNFLRAHGSQVESSPKKASKQTVLSNSPEYNIMIDVPPNPPTHLQPQISLGFLPVPQRPAAAEQSGTAGSLRNQVLSLSQHVEALNIENESLRRLIKQQSLPKQQAKLRREGSTENASMLGQPDLSSSILQQQDLMQMIMVQAKALEKCISAI